jgi:hypothetical protein
MERILPPLPPLAIAGLGVVVLTIGWLLGLAG